MLFRAKKNMKEVNKKKVMKLFHIYSEIKISDNIYKDMWVNSFV